MPPGLVNLVASRGNPARCGVSITNALVNVVPSPHLGYAMMMLVSTLWVAARNGPAMALLGNPCGGPEPAADGMLCSCQRCEHEDRSKRPNRRTRSFAR
jgi:hypothetical protein